MASGDRFDGVRAYVRSQLVEPDVASLAVAVAREGEILWEEGFGWADRESRTEATEHTLYSLASVTKPITATALMLLREQGKLDLDRPANDYLGEAKLRGRAGDAAGATVRRVANHTSGLPLHYHFFPEDEPYPRPPMDETIRRYGNLVSAPGERYQYSNLGYGVLDYVISRLSGVSYADVLRREVFLPLGMTRASVGIGPGLAPHAAARYQRDGARLPFYDFDHPGGSAVFCSAHDLARFGLFHLKAHLPDQKAILPDAAIDEMQAPTAPAGAPGQGYGIGWSTAEDDAGYRRVGHAGGMAGVSTLLHLVPSERVAVVALCNTGTGLPYEVVGRVLAALLPDYAERHAARAAQQRAERDRAKAARPKRFRPPRALLGTWRGSVHTYRGEVPLVLDVKRSGEIHARLGEQLWTLVNEPALAQDRLSGEMLGDIGTEDANRRPYHLRLDLALRGAALNGAVVAVSPPTARLGNGLSHWAELRPGPRQ